MQDISTLLPTFDSKSVKLPKVIRLERDSYRTRQRKGKPVYRFGWSQLPVSLTDHRHQFKQVGSTLYRVIAPTEKSLTAKLDAGAIADFKAKLAKPDVTYGDFKPTSVSAKMIKATPAECELYRQAVEKLRAHVMKLMVESAERLHKLRQRDLIKAIQTVNKYDLRVVRPSHHAESDDL